VGAFGNNNEFIFREVYWNAKCELDLAGPGQVLITFFSEMALVFDIRKRRQNLSLAAIISFSNSPCG
jgi:hypothetical protein